MKIADPETVAGISVALGQSFDQLLRGIGKCQED
jgi:hypothetical protein